MRVFVIVMKVFLRRGRGLLLARALVLVAAMALAFWLGIGFSSPQQRQLRGQIESLDNKVRELAQAELQRVHETAKLRAQLELGDAERAQMAAENRALISDILRRDERILTYSHIIDGGDRPIIIHAITEEPGFVSGQRQLNAVLERFRRGKFKGAYHFEIVSIINGIESVLRAPPKPAKLNFQRYLEITETVNLPDDARIIKIGVIITDNKKQTIASHEESFDDDENNNNYPDGNNGENDNNENNDDDNIPAVE